MGEYSHPARQTAATVAKNQLFLGSFVHSKALNELEYLHNAAVCVYKTGVIVAVEKDCDEATARTTLLPRLGWPEDDLQVTIARDGQFFFPGFIGQSPPSPTFQLVSAHSHP